MTSPTPATVKVAGLLIPAALAPRIIAALRWTYPEATQGRDDEAAVRASLIEWITATLLTYEGFQTDLKRSEAHQKVDATFAEVTKAAKQAAKEAAATITEDPSGAAEPNVPPV